MGKLGLLTVLLHICIPFFGQSKANQPNPNSQTEEFILGIMKNEHIPGLSIAIVKNNQLILSKGYGFANLENNVMASEKSMYGIASVTKVFTAIAVMLLVEDKKLSLNDTIGKFFSSVPELWKPITIKQLLNHTSGISSFSKHNKIPCSVGKDVREYERGDAYKLLNKTSREISELRNEYRSIQSSYDLTPSEKRYQLDELDRQMNELAREALIEIDEKQR